MSRVWQRPPLLRSWAESDWSFLASVECVNRCHAIENENSIKVIQLVLDRPGLKSFRPESGARALDNDPLGTSDVGCDVWQTETSLSGHATACGFHDARVDENNKTAAGCSVAVVADFYNPHPHQFAYLR